MNRVRTWAALGGAAVLALSLGFAANHFLTSDEPDLGALFGTRLPDLNGTETSVGHWRGKVLVVNFWATWCAPCREEIPEFVRLQSEFGPQGVQFVGIAVDQLDKVSQFAVEFKMNYPQLVGGYAALELARRAGDRIQGLPYTLVIDQQGRLVHRELGALEVRKLRSIFAKLL
ncbi:MAG: TlpA disulfide reductase family protein [Betaproteobacteria bacterium]